MNRRNLIKKTALATTAMMANPIIQSFANAEMPTPKGKLKHSVSRWCYASVPFEELCQAVKAMGMQSIELTGPDEWKILNKYGLTSAMGWGDYPKGVGLTNFFANPANHDALQQFYEDLIPKAADAGIKNLICLSGNRDGRSDYENLLNCQKGIKRIIKLAEKYNITISMELLNSKVDHRDYACDHTEWGVVLCEMVGSPNFKLLYDIYHMQIMEGDVVATIRKYHNYISHYHTAGVPGRHEINDTQELYYPIVMKAIADTGYEGFIGQEFIPTATDNAGKLEALRQAIKICTV